MIFNSFDYSEFKESGYNNENEVIDLFLQKEIELNEFQAKFLFLGNRRQGLSYLTILRIVVYLLTLHKDITEITFDKTELRGTREYDAFIQGMLLAEFSNHDSMQTRQMFYHEFINFIESNFDDYFIINKKTRYNIEVQRIKRLNDDS